MRYTCDAVIIGAGVIGSAIALELRRSGRRVIVADKGPGPGTGSTSASSTIIRFHYSYWEGVATAWEARHWWEDWPDYLACSGSGPLASYIRTGVLMVESPAFPLAGVLDHFSNAGIPCTCLEGAELEARFPFLDAHAYFPPRRVTDDAFWEESSRPLRAGWGPDGGFVTDPQLAAQNLLQATEREGATALLRRRVVGISQSRGAVHEVALDDGSVISSPVVVNAAGPHSRHINELAGVLADFRVTTRPLRQEVHYAAAPAGYQLPDAPVVTDPDLGVYFRPTPGGGLLAGGLEPECDPLIWLDDPDEVQANTTAAAHEAQLTRVARRMRGMAVPLRPRGIVGVYDATDDWIPIYDRTSLDGYYVAIGTSGNQFKAAPVVGQLIRALIDWCQSGQDHDRNPAIWKAPRTGLRINLKAYSRLRAAHSATSHSVLG